VSEINPIFITLIDYLFNPAKSRQLKLIIKNTHHNDYPYLAN
jgi:hypothetical protein